MRTLTKRLIALSAASDGNMVACHCKSETTLGDRIPSPESSLPQVPSTFCSSSMYLTVLLSRPAIFTDRSGKRRALEIKDSDEYVIGW
eukprot:SAG31_NODE_4765_length_2970_cov_21.015640_6_plen_88_part_00